jgi:hypothetical protein
MNEPLKPLLRPDHSLTTSPTPIDRPPAVAPKPTGILGFTPTKQLVFAFLIAGISDAISVFATAAPPLQWGVDLATAALLFMVLGWRWLLLPGLILEAIPGLDVFPFWLMVVGAIAICGTARPRLPKKG